MTQKISKNVRYKMQCIVRAGERAGGEGARCINNNIQ